MTLTFDLTHDLDLGCFKVKFRNSCISGVIGQIDVRWKGSELIGYWADYMTLPFDHTHDLDSGVSRSEYEIALSQEWDDRLTWNEKDVSIPFMTMMLTSVTMVGWVDVPDSDRGDIRHRRAVDISSSSVFVSWNFKVTLFRWRTPILVGPWGVVAGLPWRGTHLEWDGGWINLFFSEKSLSCSSTLDDTF